jgi:hypothetical protein
MMANVVQFHIRQRYAILTLWFQQAFTNTTWTKRNGWLLNANECDSWNGISCAPIDLGGTVGTQNVTVRVNLFNNNVKGTIPADLGLLTALTSFAASYNKLTGTLPASIGQWTALTYFGVDKNALTGTIPTSIGNWSQIRTAYFQSNQFTGIMPNGICPHIKNRGSLWANCRSEINCTCCTSCY